MEQKPRFNAFHNNLPEPGGVKPPPPGTLPGEVMFEEAFVLSQILGTSVTEAAIILIEQCQTGFDIRRRADK